MDADTWLRANASFPVPEGEFACREGCGFCCTYPPKVGEDRLAAIEADRGDTPTTRDAHGNTRLALQGGCGGCVLLDDRGCTAHEHRPDHCRFFPFHVYFGREVVVLADRVCPGIAPDEAPEGPHEPASQAPAWGSPSPIAEAGIEALAEADVDELERRADRVHEAHEDVATRARWDDRWREPEAAIADALGGARVTARAWEHALGPFRAEEVAHLPTTVLPDEEGFPWRAWRIRQDELERLRFTEDGRMKLVGTAPAPSPPRGRELREPVRTVLADLAELEPMVGACMHLVDEGMSVDDAAWRRVNDVAAGLSLHAGLLEAEGLPVTTAWLRSVYEPEFFTLETLGEWL